MYLYVVRHGQTDWNILKKVQGKADIDLNETGKKQALEIQKELFNTKIDLIICSPLKRAKQTAEIINNKNVPIIYDDRISERDFGELEGKKQDDFDFAGFWSYNKNIQYDKAENIRIFFERIYSFLDDIKNNYSNSNVLLVTHGGASIPIDCYFNEIPIDDDLLSLVLKNCEVKKYIIK